jgi:hypothetical protein
MRCAKIRKLLSVYLDGELDARTRAAVEKHLRECKGCGEEFLALKEMILELRSLDNLKAPNDFIEKVHQKIENPSLWEKVKTPLFFPLRIKIPVEITALAATAVLIFFLFNSLQSDRVVSDAPLHDKKSIVAMDSGNENRPLQLDILLGPDEGNKTLSSEKVVPVTSGSRQKSLNRNGFESGPLERNNEEWIPDDLFEDIENPFSNQSRAVSRQNDFLSDIHIILTHLKGRVLSKEYKEGTEILQYITLEIPAKNYRPFLIRLERIGSLQTPSPDLPEECRDRALLRIRIRSSEQ